MAYACEQTVHFTIDQEPNKGPLTTWDSPPSSSSSSRILNIDFNFSCTPCVYEWVNREDSDRPRFMRRYHMPMMEKQFRLTQVQLMSQETVRELIDEEMVYLGVWDENRRLLVDFAMVKAWEALKAMPDYHNTVHLNIKVAMLHNHVYDERQDIMTAIQQSMEEDRNLLVPTAESAIEALECRKTVLLLEDSENCSICLEEFLEGCEGICMPCSHVFHVDCIKMWLRTSHYCPLCRYKMPIASS